MLFTIISMTPPLWASGKKQSLIVLAGGVALAFSAKTLDLAPLWLLPFFGLPTLISSLAWYLLAEQDVSASMLLTIIYPLGALTYFSIHPSGWAPYGLYWLIVPLIEMGRIVSQASGSSEDLRYIFMRALQVTLLGHATGTLLFLSSPYATSALWQSLLPVVLIERLFFALGMTAISYGLISYKKGCQIKNARF